MIKECSSWIRTPLITELSQIQDGEERVVSYASRLYSNAEERYFVTRKELLAAVFFLKYFRQYLLGRHFRLRTDHAALKWLRRTPEQIGQQSRWLEILEEFDFTIEHRPVLCTPTLTRCPGAHVDSVVCVAPAAKTKLTCQSAQ